MNRFALMGLMLLAACEPTFDKTDTEDDVSATDSESSDTQSATDTEEPDQADQLVGVWLSEGDDVSPLLEYFDIVQIDAEFKSDLSYEVVSTDVDGAQIVYIGTYAVDLTTDIPSITLTQTSPTEVTSEGIFQVEDNTLTYEVVQTTPDIGFTPPTQEEGFGSTSGGGIAANVNIQIFQRQ